MKTVVFLIGLMFSLADAQVDSLKESLQYYPLQAQDYWEYRVSTSEGAYFSDSSAYSTEVTGDTVLPNGLTYKILHSTKLYPNRGGTWDTFVRLDSQTGCLYQYTYTNLSTIYEAKLDSLNAQAGDTIISSWEGIPGERPERTILLSVGEDTVLGSTTRVRFLHNINCPFYVEYKLAKGIGLVYQFDGDEYGTDLTNVAYARIGGVEYGAKIPLAVKSPRRQPTAFALFQNYPNPFNPSTVITYQLPSNVQVKLTIIDVLGRAVRALVDGKQSPGHHSVTFDAFNLPSGVYFYRLQAGTLSETKKLTVLK
ncbi:MAG: T9SS type A sorting domain-containing protein [Bacteroidetes bacterium]|nr:T9SS type A sorting domain-containing protein [Bacteroidota bacterium]